MKKLIVLSLVIGALPAVACSSDSTSEANQDAGTTADDDDTTDDDTGGDDDDDTTDDDTDGDDDDDTTDDDTDGDDDDGTTDDDAGSDAPDGGAESPDGGATRLTYFQDVLPIFEQRCLGCHQQGGVGPFRLDEYDSASEWAAAIKAVTQARQMPPFLLEDGEGCGDFQNSRFLSEEELATIAEWADDGAARGESREVDVPPLPTLADAEELSLPMFTPEAEEDELAQFDEYRCFLLDRRTASAYEFMTGYDVLPGNPAMVHHVTVNQVTEDGPSLVTNPVTTEPYTNGELIALMDAESPDRLGWPCLNQAGEGVDVSQIPVIWAPGQGAVRFPNDSGIILTPEDLLVVQIHYNLADPDVRGQSDQTTLRLRFEAEATNAAFLLPVDPLLSSLLSGQAPDVLPPGQEDVEVSWTETVGDLGVGGLPDLELWGLFPHMHELGTSYSMGATVGGSEMCTAEMARWDFNWQLMYFYQEGIPMAATDTLHASCRYDTSARTEPTLPGWGTQNEMCFTGLFFTAPAAAVLGL